MSMAATTQSTPNPSLPYDLLLACLARVSRLHYPTLSLVSKSFRSLLASPDLYKTRSLLDRTESCLYVCFLSSSGFDHHWFTLCRKPNQTLTNDTSKKKASGYVLATVLIHHSPPASYSALVSVGSNIYNVGQSDGVQVPRVSILDCKTHMWHEGPSLRMKQWRLSASVLDEKIYVAGCYIDVDSKSYKNSFEVFDTKTQSWDGKPILCPQTTGIFFDTSVSIDGNIYAKADNGVVAYNPKEGRWDLFVCNMWRFFVFSCVVENVLYSVYFEGGNDLGVLRWYDTKVRTWKKLKGLVGLPKFPDDACVRFANYGGKMAILWDERLPCGEPLFGEMKMVWCAVIALERRKSCEIWGIVEWFDHVLTIPIKYALEKVISAIV